MVERLPSVEDDSIPMRKIYSIPDAASILAADTKTRDRSNSSSRRAAQTIDDSS